MVETIAQVENTETVEQTAECNTEPSKDEQAECKKKADEQAECKKKAQEDAECKKQEAQEQDASCGKKKCAEDETPAANAECDTDDETSDPEDDKEKEVEQDAACKKKTAEFQKYDTLIAELNEKMAQLVAEVASMKSKMEQTVVAATEQTASEQIAESHEQIAEVQPKKSMRDELLVNPFMAEISSPVKYSLLDKYEKKTGYSLLQRR